MKKAIFSTYLNISYLLRRAFIHTCVFLGQGYFKETTMSIITIKGRVYRELKYAKNTRIAFNDDKKRIPYKYYLKTKHWKNKRNQLKRNCDICGSFENLHLHHNTYDHLWKEKPKDLVCLCKEHHFGVHNFTGIYKRSVGFKDFRDYKELYRSGKLDAIQRFLEEENEQNEFLRSIKTYPLY
jgi:hypothetical protein